MADSDAKLTSWLLHVRPSSAEACRAMDARLAALSVDADVCGDVYRALARLCAHTAGPTRIVILCVDNLSPREFEFIKLARKVRSELSIHVYGNSRYEQRLIDAVKAGADGRVTIDTLGTVVDRCAEHAPAVPAASPAADVHPPAPSPNLPDTGAQPRESASAEDQAGEQPPIEDPLAAGTDHGDGPAGQAPCAESPSTQPVDEDDDEPHQEPVRVPWLRRHNAPVRIAPGSARRDGDDDEEADDQPRPARRERGEPLLTEAELRALIGDDDAAEDDDDEHAERGASS